MIVRLYKEFRKPGQRWADRVYQVSSETQQGVWHYVWIPSTVRRVRTCSCPSYTFRKRYEFECKHIDEVRKQTSRNKNEQS